MARKPLDPKTGDAVLIDWRVGQLSQRDIAEKHKISLGLVNRLCKGVERDMAPIVNAQVQVNQGLANQSERMVNAVHDAADEIVRMQRFFRGANMLVANTVATKVKNDGDKATYKDLASAAVALGRTQESVLGKMPDTVINNSNNNTAQAAVVTPAELRRINQMLEDGC